MPSPGIDQITDYVRRQGLLTNSSNTQATQLSLGFDSSLYEIRAEAENEPLIVKYFTPELVDAARREAEGLRVCGAVGLAPTLVAFEEVGATVGGPLIIYRQPNGIPLGDRPLIDEQVNSWMFVLLTLHHLAPGKVQQRAILSPGIEQWWERIQPLWNEVRAAYVESMYQPLIDALTKLHGLVDVHVRTNRDLWSNVPRRPCHGDPIPVNLIDAQGRLVLVDWSGFGLGDIALEIGRAAALAALNEEISSEQYIRMITDYLDGTRDLKDTTLEQRLQVYASVFPYGYTLFMLSFLARLQKEGPESTLVDNPAEYRGRGLMSIARSLTWIQDALGVEIATPPDVLAPFGQITIARE
jgi:Phosphotransferase enzyme family